jgi:repressor LexA
MTTLKKLTQRQEEIYKMIEKKIREHGAPPTRAEIAEHMGFKSANAAEDHLRALARKGLLKLIPGTSRGIRLVEDCQGIPLIKVKEIKAPLLNSHNIQQYLNIDDKIFFPHPNYVLSMPDDSMSHSGIFKNDYLCIHEAKDASNGQTIVAIFHDEVLVRKFKRNLHEITLEAANSHYETITVPHNHPRLHIEGICVGVIRNHI